MANKKGVPIKVSPEIGEYVNLACKPMLDKGPTASKASKPHRYSTQNGDINVLDAMVLGPKLCKGKVVAVGSGVNAIAGSPVS